MSSVIYFAGGCFWGTEKLFSSLPGVLTVTSGYANGNKTDPTYDEVCEGKTNFRETVRVSYDSDNIELAVLLQVFFAIIDPTVSNRQGNDFGSQYQTGVYFCDDESAQIVREIANQEKAKHEVFAVEIKPLENFFEAEEYHQRYLEKHPGGYCHISYHEFMEARKIVETHKK